MTTSTSPRKQQGRSCDTQRMLSDALVTSLDRHGYSATTLATVQEICGASRGVMLHHFSTKRDLVVFTAKRILDQALQPTKALAIRDQDIGRLILFYWQRILNTPEGRAFVEILSVTRTDAELNTRISHIYAEWEADLAALAIARFPDATADPTQLWKLVRVFLRGLILETGVSVTPSETTDLVATFANLISPHLNPKAVSS